MNYYRGRLFDHIHLKVKNINRSREFYRPVIESLGLTVSFDNGDSFCIDELFVSESKEPTHAVHLAFQAENPGAVNLFYETALKNGGKCNGEPRTRHFHQNSYSAYVLDPDGNNLEAIFHGPTKRSHQHVEISPLR